MNNQNEFLSFLPVAWRRFPSSRLVLLLISLLPALVTWLAFGVQLSQEIIYPVGKALILTIPILWIILRRQSFSYVISKWGLRHVRGDFRWAFGSGLVVSALIFILYFALFRDSLEGELIRRALPAYALEYFWVTALFISLWNSLIEEYFWRAFLLAEMAERMGKHSALLLNGVLFSIHHLIILYLFFPDERAFLFSFGTALGGWLWSWLRLRGQSIWACYISHLIVDFALMGIGYWVLFIK